MEEKIVRKGHPVLAFFLGLLLGIILIVGLIAGGVYFALTYKLDNVEQNKDENGNYIYINANPDEGGAENVLDLVQKVMGFASDSSTLTIGAVENLLPVANSLTDKIMEALGEYVTVDEAALKNTPVYALESFFQEAVMNIRPAALIDKFGGSVSDNKLLQIFLNGTEASYVEYGGYRYPVYYDNFVKNGNSYIRDGGDRAQLRPIHQDYLQEGGKLYFFNRGDNYFVTYPADNGYAYTEGDDMVYSLYNSSYSHLTGNYYYSGSEKVEVTPVTIRSLSDGSAIAALDNLMVTELLKGNSGDGEYADITDKILGGISVGQLVSGNVDFEELMMDLELANLVEVDPTNTVFVYLAYGVTGSYKGSDETYHANYKLSDNSSVNCILETKQGKNGLKVTRAYYIGEDGNEVEIPATTVGEVESRVSNITKELAIADLLYIDAPGSEKYSAVMTFFAFSVTDVEEAEAGLNYAYTGVYHPFDEASENQECYITVESNDGDKVISDILTKNEKGEFVSVERTKIVDVNRQISRLTQTLRIRDLIKVDKNDKIMAKLADYAIDDVGKAAQDLSLDDFIDVETGSKSNSIISYIVYGVTEIKQTEDGNYTGVYSPLDSDEKVTASLKVENGKITEVYTEKYGKISGTKVNEVNDRVKGVTSDLTLGELVDVEGNKMLEAISSSTIDSLPQDIANLSINELYADEVYKTEQIYLAETYVESYVYYTLDNGKYTLVNAGKENAGKLTESEFESGRYYTYGETNSLWKLLLYVGGSEQVYSVNNISKMITNITSNIQNTQMYELHDAGVLVFNPPEQLDKVYNGKKIGEYKLSEFVFLAVNILTAVSSLPSGN